MTAQFVRLPQCVTATDGRLGVLSLVATAGWLLSNPKGYTAPHGGIKAQLKRYFRAGSRFAGDWTAFVDNHLKMARAPLGENRFHTFYELSWKANRQIPSLRFLTAKQGRTYSERAYVEPTEQFTPVPVALLKDPALSAAAKGVVILAIRELALQQHKAGHIASKEHMMRWSGVKPSSFEAAWQEAKESGYIVQRRLLDKKTGRITWGYSVASSPAEAARNRESRTEQSPVNFKGEVSAIHDETRQARPVVLPDEREAVEELVKRNIGYTDLLRVVHVPPEELNGYVRLIVDTVCTTHPTVRIGGAELPADTVREALLALRFGHMVYVVAGISGARIQRNPWSYKLTALYNAVASV